MRVVVTGGAGFIGANLCRHLVINGHEVVVIDDLSTGALSNLLGIPVDFVEGSIVDDAVLDRACAGASAVVHLAALGSVPRSLADPAATHLANSTGTVAVLEAARRHGGLHTVVASSSSVYGGNPILPKHEDLATRPLSPYAASKLATEGYALAWASSYGLPVLAFRFFNVFGPLQSAGHVYAAVIPSFVRAALLEETLTVHGDGQQSRDFTYVGSVIDIIVDALERRVVSGGPVNLAFGTRVPLLRVIDEIQTVLDKGLKIEYVEGRAGDVKHSQADASLLKELFPQIHPVPFGDGLRATIEWMQETLLGEVAESGAD